jgi:hypothetical protein
MKSNTSVLENRDRVNQIYSFPAVKQIRERYHFYCDRKSQLSCDLSLDT